MNVTRRGSLRGDRSEHRLEPAAAGWRRRWSSTGDAGSHGTTIAEKDRIPAALRLISNQSSEQVTKTASSHVALAVSMFVSVRSKTYSPSAFVVGSGRS
jgi:hypothetical protein